MNIMLTDLHALTLEVQEIPAVADSGADSFAGMFHQQFPEVITDGDQMIDFKEYFENIPLQVEPSTIGPEAPRLPSSQLPSAQILNFTDPVSTISPDHVDSQLTTPLKPVVSVLAEAPQKMAAGEFLPAGGNQLPPEGLPSSVDPVVSETVVKIPPATDITPAAIGPVELSAVQGRLSTAGWLPAQRPVPAAIASLDATLPGRADLVVQPPGPVSPILKEKPVSADSLQAVAGPKPPDVGNGLARESGLMRELLAAAAVSAPQIAMTPKMAQQSPVAPVIAGREFMSHPAPETVTRVVGNSGDTTVPVNPSASQTAADRAILPRDNGLPGETLVAREIISGSENRTHEVPGQTAASSAQQSVPTVTGSAAAAPVAVAGNVASVNQQNPLPPHLETMSLKPNADSNEWSNGLGERVNWMINQKQNTATIRLDPPTLGKLDVQIKIVDDAATITIQTQTAQTRDLIDSASIRLRDFLQDSGYQNVNVDVSQRQDQQQARSQTAAGTNSEQDDNSGQEQAEDHQQQQQTSYFIGDGLVDTFA